VKFTHDSTGLATGRPGEPWPRAVLFDLDGTLVDTGPDIAVAINRMLAEMGREVYPEQRILNWVGDGARRLVKRALVGSMEGEPPEDEFQQGYALFYEHYAEAICVYSKPYPHAEDVLNTLAQRGILLACVTNKPVRHTRLLLEALSLERAFQFVVGGDTLQSRKPDPGPLRHACQSLQVAESDTVYVGDSMTDCRAAESADMPMVAVSYGYHGTTDLTQAPCAAIIDSLDELPETLNTLQRVK